MNELKGEYEIVGQPTQCVYKKKENGLYEITFKNYIFESPTGERYTGMLQCSNCSFKADKDEGVILLENYNDLKQFKPIATEDEDKTIFDLIISEVKDGE